MSKISDLVAAAINSAVQMNKPRADDEGEARLHGVIAVNALHTAVIGIASRVESADPHFDRDAFVKACGTVGAI